MRAFLIAAALTLLTAGVAFAADAGSVVGLNGACSVERGGNRTPLTLGAALQVGDVVDVPADGRLKLRMADGSILALGSEAHFTVTTYALTAGGQRQDAKLSLTQGLLHAIVAPVEPAAKFEVQTAVGTAAVRSTDWLIEATATSQQVAVLSGSVAVTSGATGHGVIVPAGRRTQLQAGRDPLPPRRLERAEFARLLGRTEIRGPQGRPQPPHPGPPPHSPPPGGAPPPHVGEPMPPPHPELPPPVEPHRHRIEPPPPHREPHHPYRHPPPRERWREHRDRGWRDHRPQHDRRYPDRGERR